MPESVRPAIVLSQQQQQQQHTLAAKQSVEANSCMIASILLEVPTK
jgi:hypothetical protein